MKLKIASYNISGGFYNSDENGEYLDKERAENIDNKMLKEIIETINNEDIDVICFQEIITTERIHYIDSICSKTKLKYSESYELSECNTVKNTRYGNAVLSKYPLELIKKELFPNPGLTKKTSSGKIYYLYDQGYMIVNLKAGNKSISILNHHGFPYGTFDSTPEENIQVFDFFDKVIKENSLDVVVGDFNDDNFMNYLKYTKDNYIRTINRATTSKGNKLDDILLFKNSSYSSDVLKLLSDHYLIITNIEI